MNKGWVFLLVVLFSAAMAMWVQPWLTSSETVVAVHMPSGYAEQDPEGKAQLLDIWNSQQSSALELSREDFLLRAWEFDNSLVLLREDSEAYNKLTYVGKVNDVLVYTTQEIVPPARQITMTNRYSLDRYQDLGRVTIVGTRNLGWAIAFSALWLLVTAAAAFVLESAARK